MADKVKIGIVGVGQIGTSHVAKYQKLPVEIVAIADASEEACQRVSQEYGIATTYTDFRKLLARDDIVAVDVCLHNNLHAPVTIAALQAGKNVYCEKPIAGSYVDGKAMVDMAKQTGRMLSIQLATLFSPETKAARRLIDEGHLGDVYYAKSYGFRRRGRPFVDGYGSNSFVQTSVAAGGAMFDMGVYHIAQVLYLLGNPAVETVTGATHQAIPMYEDRQKSSGYDVEELGIGFARLAGGISMAIEESWAINLAGNEGGSKIAGSKGGVQLAPFSFHTTVSDMELNATFDIGDADRRWHSCIENTDAYDSPQAHWAAALQGRVPLLDTAGLALRTMLISQGIYLSQRLGREVTAADIEAQSVSTALKL
jgi:predicted dehydrogenase